MEIYAYVNEVVSLLQLKFEFPTGASRPLHNPDTLLVACLVFVTKLLYPMDDVPRRIPGGDDMPCLNLNWDQWHEVFTRTSTRFQRRDFNKLSSEDVESLSPEQMEEYLQWYQQTRTAPTEGWSISPYIRDLS